MNIITNEGKIVPLNNENKGKIKYRKYRNVCVCLCGKCWREKAGCCLTVCKSMCLCVCAMMINMSMYLSVTHKIVNPFLIKALWYTKKWWWSNWISIMLIKVKIHFQYLIEFYEGLLCGGAMCSINSNNFLFKESIWVKIIQCDS